MSARKDLTGQKFGRLTALAPDHTNKRGRLYWRCRCDCGKITVVETSQLTSGNTKSCGCYNHDKITKHGMHHTKIYQTWQDVKRRVFNFRCKSYKDYGGRGITMYPAWANDFQAFYDYVSKLPHFGEEGYSLDRIDNNGNYEPDNVRWATAKEQSRNVRTNRFVEYQGRIITLAEAVELTGICWKTLDGRIKRGETGEYLFRLPTKHN